MILNRESLSHIAAEAGIILPATDVFALPEKVLQFGTGVLLRGLPDFFIDAANRQGLFNGRIVVVKSTDAGDSTAFDRQDGLFTVCTRGLEEGKKIEEDTINASVSRVISAKSGWKEILLCAHNPDMKLIVSNTTEVGISFMEDDISSSPPVSFPGKLLAFLYERYKAFNGSDDSGMVIIPTELIPDNGRKLEAIVLQLAAYNKIEEGFADWLKNSNHFCSSLVDRIVPGTPPKSDKDLIENKLQYEDDLLIIAEAYRLWAIEAPPAKLEAVLSFQHADAGVVVAPDITKYRELKLRLLNGTHTICCGLGVLSGFETVKEGMDNKTLKGYMVDLMMDNIIPAIVKDDLTEAEAKTFALKVLDRFQNPHIHHKWLSITLQYSSKMKMRNLPVLFSYFERLNIIPAHLAIGFAAFIAFMKSEKAADGKYYGEIEGRPYLVQDDKAAYISEKWQKAGANRVAEDILSDVSLWGSDLAQLDGFLDAVNEALGSILKNGALATLQNRQTDKTRIQDEK